MTLVHECYEDNVNWNWIEDLSTVTASNYCLNWDYEEV
jgi:hypothetical protein